MGIGDVNRQAQARQRIHGLSAVDRLRCENQIRGESGDLLEIRIDGSSDVRLPRRCRRVITKRCVAHQAIAFAHRENDFRQIRGEGNDAAHIPPHVHLPPNLIRELRRSRLRRDSSAGEKNED